MTSRIARHRADAAAKQGGRCWYCNRRMGGAGLLECTAEHLLPRSEGGGDGVRNIVAACWYCNQERARLPQVPTPRDFRTHVRLQVKAGLWNGARRQRSRERGM